MSVQSESGADRVLCISVDNSPLHGAYFVDPGVQQSSTLSNPAVAPSVSLQAAVRALPAPASGFAAGARVFHIKFGPGCVVAADGPKLTIDFDRAGRKLVMESFVTPEP